MPRDRVSSAAVQRLFTLLALGIFVLRTSLASDGAPASASPPAAPFPVRSQSVEERTTQAWEEVHGFVRSRKTVEVMAQVLGRVKVVHVRAGQAVDVGDLLVELDGDEARAKLEAATSRQAAAEAVEVEAAQILGRIEGLFTQGAATREELDGAIARRKTARAAVDAARAQVAESREFLGHAEIRSPIRGVVVDKWVNPGDLSGPGPGGAPGSGLGAALVTLYDPEALWFEGAIPERFGTSVRTGTPARVLLGPDPIEIEGRFVEVVPGVDDTARTFVARVDLPASPALKLGMFGRVRFPTGERKIVAVPAEAVVARGQLDTTFVVEGQQARLRLVRLGRPAGTGVEILSGLKAGERVVLDPPEHLRDGDRIQDEGLPQ